MILDLGKWRGFLDDLLTPHYPKRQPPYDGLRFTLDQVSRDLVEFCRSTGDLRERPDARYRYLGTLKAADGTIVAVIAVHPNEPFAREWVWINPSKGGLSLGQTLAIAALAGGSVAALDQMSLRDAHVKLDLKGVTVAELVQHLEIKYGRKARNFRGTVYVNSRRGTHFAIYDLGARLNQEPDQLTRLEIRVRFKTDSARNQRRYSAWDWAESGAGVDEYVDRVTIGDPKDETLWPNIPDLIGEQLEAWHSDLNLSEHWLEDVARFMDNNTSRQGVERGAHMGNPNDDISWRV